MPKIAKASLLSMSAVALTLLTTAPGPWDARASEERPPRTSEPVAQTSFLAPAALAEALRLAGPNIAPAEALGPSGLNAAPDRSPRWLDSSPAWLDEPAEQAEGVPREFYFSRVMYPSYRGGFRRGGGGSWATDYPRADQIFLSFIDRLLSNLDAYEREHTVRLDDPDLRRFPFLYALEVGRMALRPPEIEGLRDYLLAGGFLVIDDFWGSYQWANFEYEIRQVLPDHEIVDLTLDHPIFTAFYEIDEILQVPNINNGIRGGPTHQSDGYVPWVKGIHDENGRLMVIINWNTDLGDAWEWADDPRYPLRYSTYSYEMGVNFIVYAMSH